jgi:hypothetical protein
VIVRPTRQDRGWDLGLSALIDEDVGEELERSLRFADRLLERIDATRRLTQAAPVAGLLRAGYTAWRTRAEHAAKSGPPHGRPGPGPERPPSEGLHGQADGRGQVAARGLALPQAPPGQCRHSDDGGRRDAAERVHFTGLDNIGAHHRDPFLPNASVIFQVHLHGSRASHHIHRDRGRRS